MQTYSVSAWQAGIEHGVHASFGCARHDMTRIRNEICATFLILWTYTTHTHAYMDICIHGCRPDGETAIKMPVGCIPGKMIHAWMSASPSCRRQRVCNHARLHVQIGRTKICMQACAHAHTHTHTHTHTQRVPPPYSHARIHGETGAQTESRVAPTRLNMHVIKVQAGALHVISTKATRDFTHENSTHKTDSCARARAAGSEGTLAKISTYFNPLAAAWVILKRHEVRPLDVLEVTQSGEVTYSVCGIGWGIPGKMAEESEALRSKYGRLVARLCLLFWPYCLILHVRVPTFQTCVHALL